MVKETYHDYVIKDGQFIGKFDELYSKFDDPWRQSSQPNKFSRMAGIIHLKNYSVNSVVECGCGLGYYAEWINLELGIVPKSIDVSPVAVAKAKGLFPHLDFEVADIVTDLCNYKNYECVLFSEIIWYILPDLNKIFNDLKNNFADKFLLVNQVFYKGSQKYGNEYFTSLSEFINYVPFPVVGKCEATMTTDTTIESSTLFKIQ